MAVTDAAKERAVPHLSSLLDQSLLSPAGDGIGRIDDVVVRLRGREYPVVTGLVAGVGHRRVFVPVDRVSQLGVLRVVLAGTQLDLRAFERRDGEVCLRGDLLGHRLIDVAGAALVRAWDVELTRSGNDWLVSCLDTRRPARLFGLVRRGRGHECEDWRSFEPLIGHGASRLARGPFAGVRRLKPAQLADLLEEASGQEGREILDVVRADPELEADVFEELDPDIATRLLRDRDDADVAAVLARMQADDAVDALAELPQERRQAIIDLLPEATRTRVLGLMGFNPTTAGGLMVVELVTAPGDATVEEGLRRVRLADGVAPEARLTLHAVGADGALVGAAAVSELLTAPPEALLVDVVDRDPVRVLVDTELVDIALLMADYNLVTVAVVDAANRLLGAVTVDDVLEAVIPEDWRRREPAARPEPTGDARGGE